MANLTYLVFNFTVMVSAVIITKKFNLTNKISIKPLAFSYLFVALPFLAWDVWATDRGHWYFNDSYITGVSLFDLPVEEALFFITVPLVSLVVFLALYRVKNATQAVNFNKQLVLMALLVIGVALWLLSTGGYSKVVFLAMAITAALLLKLDKLASKRQFWSYQAVIFGLFFLANTFLTALPIVGYGPQHIIGLRIGTIPIEDFAYNFVLTSGFVAVYKKYQP